MNPVIYDFMDGMFNLILIFVVVGIAAQIIIAFKAKWIWGMIFPLYAFVCALFWSANPIREGNHPTMTVMNAVFIYLPLTALYLIIFFICNAIKNRMRTK